MAHWKNWMGNQVCFPSQYLHLRDLSEILQTIKDAAKAKRKVKVVGGSHTWSPITCTDGIMIDLRHFDKILAVDLDLCQVKVEAGISLKHLIEKLDDMGLALPIRGAVEGQSIAGAVSTSTHGSSKVHGTISTLVVEIELATADGSLLVCSREKNEDIFFAACCGLGCLGVITALTLQVGRAFFLEGYEFLQTREETLGSFEEMADQFEYFGFWIIPHTDKVLVRAFNRAEKGKVRSRIGEWTDKVLVNNYIVGSCIHAIAFMPSLLPGYWKLLSSLKPKKKGYQDKSYCALRYPAKKFFMQHWEAEYAAPIEKTREVVEKVFNLLDTADTVISYPIDIRFVDADDIWMSPAYGRKSCYVDFMQNYRFSFDAYLKLAEKIMDPIGARPHWGKAHNKTARQLAPLYPKWEEFKRVRASLDPQGMFVNQYIQDVLLG